MPLIPLLPLFHSLNRRFFENSLTKGVNPLVEVKWSDGRMKKTAGLYRRCFSFSKHLLLREIILSKPILEKLPIEAIESTLCHEIIHAWIDIVLRVEESHGANFYSRMNLINSVQDQFQVSIRHKFPVSLSKPKWWALCPSCGLRFTYRRIVRGAACKKCCNEFHRGVWHSSCLLEYIPISTTN